MEIVCRQKNNVEGIWVYICVYICVLVCAPIAVAHCPLDSPPFEGSQAITQQLLKNTNKHTFMRDHKRIHLFVP